MESEEQEAKALGLLMLERAGSGNDTYARDLRRWRAGSTACSRRSKRSMPCPPCRMMWRGMPCSNSSPRGADELERSAALFSFSAWRDWLNRELEAANFRDAGISSSIVLTPLTWSVPF